MNVEYEEDEETKDLILLLKLIISVLSTLMKHSESFGIDIFSILLLV